MCNKPIAIGEIGGRYAFYIYLEDERTHDKKGHLATKFNKVGASYTCKDCGEKVSKVLFVSKG